MKLHQALALHGQAFSGGESALTKAYHAMQRKELLAGISKTYAPVAEDGQTLPAEGTRLQLRVPVLLSEAVPAIVRQIDFQATVDTGNQSAKANVVVDGEVLLPDVPVETLLFLEKKLKTVIKDLLTNLPTVDEAEEWVDAGDGLSWKSAPSGKTRTDKVPHAFVKAAATDKHPAQVDTIYLDEVVGIWTTVRFSGALKASQKAALLAKAHKLLAAVQIARGEANSVEVEQRDLGAAITKFLGWTE